MMKKKKKKEEEKKKILVCESEIFKVVTKDVFWNVTARIVVEIDHQIGHTFTLKAVLVGFCEHLKTCIRQNSLASYKKIYLRVHSLYFVTFC